MRKHENGDKIIRGFKPNMTAKKPLLLKLVTWLDFRFEG